MMGTRSSLGVHGESMTSVPGGNQRPDNLRDSPVVPELIISRILNQASRYYIQRFFHGLEPLVRKEQGQ